MRLLRFTCLVLALGCELPAMPGDDAGTSDVDAGSMPTADAGLPDAGPPPRVRLGTFNLRLYFDTVCQSGQCGSADFEVQRTQAAFDTRTNQLASAITALNADLVALQEVENQDCLNALLTRLPAMPYGALGEIGTPGSVDVAIVSKYPIDQVIPHRMTVNLVRPDGSLTSFSRELLEVDTHLPGGQPVFLFAAHFRSKVSDDPGRRYAEAAASRRIVETRAMQRPDALIVLGGDLNDTPDSAPLQAMTADAGLVRVAADIPLADQYTYFFNGTGQAIDHLLQAKTQLGVVVARSALTWGPSNGYAGSDHQALTADFEMRAP